MSFSMQIKDILFRPPPLEPREINRIGITVKDGDTYKIVWFVREDVKP
jgi:hypothetical protein